MGTSGLEQLLGVLEDEFSDFEQEQASDSDDGQVSATEQGTCTAKVCASSHLPIRKGSLLSMIGWDPCLLLVCSGAGMGGRGVVTYQRHHSAFVVERPDKPASSLLEVCAQTEQLNEMRQAHNKFVLLSCFRRSSSIVRPVISGAVNSSVLEN